jgi:hypothetical protein
VKQCNRCRKPLRECVKTDCRTPDWWALTLLLWPEEVDPEMRVEFLPRD